MINNDFNFIFGQKFKDLLIKRNVKIKSELFGNQTNAIKGLTISTGDIYINLSSPFWKLISEDVLISQVANTITHEYIHLILYEQDFSVVGEEVVCQILANQRQDFKPI